MPTSLDSIVLPDTSSGRRIAALRDQTLGARAAVRRVVWEVFCEAWPSLSDPAFLVKLGQARRNHGPRGLLDVLKDFYAPLGQRVEDQLQREGIDVFREPFLRVFRHVFWAVEVSQGTPLRAPEHELRPLMQLLGLPVSMPWSLDFRAARARRALEALLDTPELSPAQVARWKAWVGTSPPILAAFDREVEAQAPWPDVVGGLNWEHHRLLEDARIPMAPGVAAELLLRDAHPESLSAKRALKR